MLLKLNTSFVSGGCFGGFSSTTTIALLVDDSTGAGKPSGITIEVDSTSRPSERAW